MLTEVIEAAELSDTARLGKDAMAALDDLKRKGPGSTRDLLTWGSVGQAALSFGCLGLAVAGQVEAGIPWQPLAGRSARARCAIWGRAPTETPNGRRRTFAAARLPPPGERLIQAHFRRATPSYRALNRCALARCGGRTRLRCGQFIRHR